MSEPTESPLTPDEQAQLDRAHAFQKSLNDAKLGSSGVVAEELARAARDTPGRRDATPPPDTPGTLALQALELANGHGEMREETVLRAAEYLKFLKENQDG